MLTCAWKSVSIWHKISFCFTDHPITCNWRQPFAFPSRVCSSALNVRLFIHYYCLLLSIFWYELPRAIGNDHEIYCIKLISFPVIRKLNALKCSKKQFSIQIIILLLFPFRLFHCRCQYYLSKYPWVPAYQGVITFFVIANFTLATFMDPGVIRKLKSTQNRFESALLIVFYSIFGGYNTRDLV